MLRVQKTGAKIHPVTDATGKDVPASGLKVFRPEADTRIAGAVRPRGGCNHQALQPGGRHILLTLRYR